MPPDLPPCQAGQGHPRMNPKEIQRDNALFSSVQCVKLNVVIFTTIAKLNRCVTWMHSECDGKRAGCFNIEEDNGHERKKV
jgi:hypothetical protein